MNVRRPSLALNSGRRLALLRRTVRPTMNVGWPAWKNARNAACRYEANPATATVATTNAPPGIDTYCLIVDDTAKDTPKLIPDPPIG